MRGNNRSHVHHKHHAYSVESTADYVTTSSCSDGSTTEPSLVELPCEFFGYSPHYNPSGCGCYNFNYDKLYIKRDQKTAKLNETDRSDIVHQIKERGIPLRVEVPKRNHSVPTSEVVEIEVVHSPGRKVMAESQVEKRKQSAVDNMIGTLKQSKFVKSKKKEEVVHSADLKSTSETFDIDRKKESAVDDLKGTLEIDGVAHKNDKENHCDLNEDAAALHSVECTVDFKKKLLFVTNNPQVEPGLLGAASKAKPANNPTVPTASGPSFEEIPPLAAEATPCPTSTPTTSLETNAVLPDLSVGSDAKPNPIGCDNSKLTKNSQTHPPGFNCCQVYGDCKTVDEGEANVEVVSTLSNCGNQKQEEVEVEETNVADLGGEYSREENECDDLSDAKNITSTAGEVNLLDDYMKHSIIDDQNRGGDEEAEEGLNATNVVKEGDKDCDENIGEEIINDPMEGLATISRASIGEEVYLNGETGGLSLHHSNGLVNTEESRVDERKESAPDESNENRERKKEATSKIKRNDVNDVAVLDSFECTVNFQKKLVFVTNDIETKKGSIKASPKAEPPSNLDASTDSEPSIPEEILRSAAEASSCSIVTSSSSLISNAIQNDAGALGEKSSESFSMNFPDEAGEICTTKRTVNPISKPVDNSPSAKETEEKSVADGLVVSISPDNKCILLDDYTQQECEAELRPTFLSNLDRSNSGLQKDKSPEDVEIGLEDIINSKIKTSRSFGGLPTLDLCEPGKVEGCTLLIQPRRSKYRMFSYNNHFADRSHGLDGTVPQSYPATDVQQKSVKCRRAISIPTLENLELSLKREASGTELQQSNSSAKEEYFAKEGVVEVAHGKLASLGGEIGTSTKQRNESLHPGLEESIPSSSDESATDPEPTSRPSTLSREKCTEELDGIEMSDQDFFAVTGTTLERLEGAPFNSQERQAFHGSLYQTAKTGLRTLIDFHGLTKLAHGRNKQIEPPTRSTPEQLDPKVDAEDLTEDATEELAENDEESCAAISALESESTCTNHHKSLPESRSKPGTFNCFDLFHCGSPRSVMDVIRCDEINALDPTDEMGETELDKSGMAAYAEKSGLDESKASAFCLSSIETEVLDSIEGMVCTAMNGSKFTCGVDSLEEADTMPGPFECIVLDSRIGEEASETSESTQSNMKPKPCSNHKLDSYHSQKCRQKHHEVCHSKKRSTHMLEEKSVWL